MREIVVTVAPPYLQQLATGVATSLKLALRQFDSHRDNHHEPAEPLATLWNAPYDNLKAAKP